MTKRMMWLLVALLLLAFALRLRDIDRYDLCATRRGRC